MGVKRVNPHPSPPPDRVRQLLASLFASQTAQNAT